MEPLIAVGGILFYAILAVFSVILIACIEYDKGWFSSITLVVLGLTLYFGMDINVILFAIDNPLLAFEYLVGYFVLGMVWGFAKWWFYSKKMLDVAKNVKIQFLNQYSITGNTIPEDKKKDFVREVKLQSEYTDRDYPPQVMNHKADWLMWAAYWPFSFFWTTLNQPIKNLWLFIYSYVGQTMQNMTNRMFEKI